MYVAPKKGVRSNKTAPYKTNRKDNKGSTKAY